MPLFEFQCLQCDKTFEEIVFGDAKPKCPSCESRRLRKLLSVFAVSSGHGTSAKATESADGCGRCGDPRGPGSCAVN